MSTLEHPRPEGLLHNPAFSQVVAAAGASYADVVKITTYVVNYKPEDRAIVGKARAPFFANGTPPASTLVGVAALALPEWLVEIEAIAVVE